MQLNLTGHHVEITPPLREYIENKLHRLTRHLDHVLDVHCILTVEKLRHKAEATVHVSGSTLFADAIADDMYAAIDALADKLDRQVRRHKEKLTNHHPRNSGKRNIS